MLAITQRPAVTLCAVELYRIAGLCCVVACSLACSSEADTPTDSSSANADRGQTPTDAADNEADAVDNESPVPSATPTTTQPEHAEAAEPLLPSGATEVPPPETAPAPAVDLENDVLIVPDEPPPATPSQVDEESACVSTNVAAELEPVILAFAFDVSGSMGQGDYAYHHRGLKWEPVVAATKAFFNDPQSSGLSASLTFFPNQADDICEATGYVSPDMPLTELPSPAFSDAIDAVTPADEDDWRNGTPTWAVLEGTFSYLEQSIAEHPDARHAIVMVTDGEPSACGGDLNDIEAVADYVESYSAVAPTYVIGVGNPITVDVPDPPDVVSKLHLVAEHGGTDTAFIIDTGDAEQTAADFTAVVEEIRGGNLSCTLAIPPAPEGEVLDTALVNVTYESETAGTLQLAYSQDCGEQNSWYFDDPDAPSTVTLCDDTCSSVLGDPTASLQVEFGCVRRSTSRRVR